MFLRVIACEIAFREFCHLASTSPNLLDFDFLTQGFHDTPGQGRIEIQKRIDAVPAGKYDAILLGYGLCSNILQGLVCRHTRLVIPRAHDCITFFLGSKERYREEFEANPGTYYYTSGWLECLRRRNEDITSGKNMFLPAHSQASTQTAYDEWVRKYGEEQAKYLLEVMGEWTANYTRGTLIDFDFTKPLRLSDEVQKICAERGWEYSESPGNLRLLQLLVDGPWPDSEFLTVLPGEKVVASNDDRIVQAVSASLG
jgi:hypothetical protein